MDQAIRYPSFNPMDWVQQVFESSTFPSPYWTPDSQHLLIVVYPQSDDRLLTGRLLSRRCRARHEKEAGISTDELQVSSSLLPSARRQTLIVTS
jgi:hypothetical protein